MANAIDVIVGAQFGSESKGRVTAEVARKRRAQGMAVTGVRVAGPNAGHVVIDDKGRRWALRQVPVAVIDPLATLVIAAGSEVDVTVLDKEVTELEDAGFAVRSRLLIDEEATWLETRHIGRESDMNMHHRIGSTGKGVGAARADRIMREAACVGDEGRMFSAYGSVLDTVSYLDDVLTSGTGHAVVIEGTQGYGLGLHAGHYPKSTSSDCRAIDFLGMAGLSPWAYDDTLLDVWVVARVYPIRVAGDSGALKGETSWEALGLPVELTTVTQKVRRVGEWDARLVNEAVRQNGGPRARVALAMADQKIPAIAGETELPEYVTPWSAGLFQLVMEVAVDAGAPVYCVGTGPDSTIWLPQRWIETQREAIKEASGR